MRISSKAWIVAGAAVAGALVGAALPVALHAQSSLSGWVFGVFLGLAQSLAGLYVYRLSLAFPQQGIGLNLASGIVRLVVILFALALAIRAGLPTRPLVWSVLSMYVAMMVAEIFVVAQNTNAMSPEAT